MREDLKRKLDESVPEDVTLSDAKKRQILKAAQERDSERNPSRVPKLVPALVGVAVIGVGAILGYPYVSDLQEQRGAVEAPEPQLQKLVVPGHDSDVLIRSIYNEFAGELLLTDSDKIYAYALAEDEEAILVGLEDGTKSFQFETTGKWLAWEEFSDDAAVLKIMNRETEEVETIEGAHVIDLLIEGDRLVYGQFGGETTPNYQSVDLNTMESETVHNMVGEVGMGPASIWNSKLLIPEMVDVEGVPVSNFYIYNLEDNSLMKKITLPYPSVNGVVINNDRIYAEFWREKMDGYFLGYIDIESEEVTEIAAPEFLEFAVYGDYLALSETTDADSSELQVYRMNGTKLEEMSAFSEIEERLVSPRFTQEGTLVVNGEGEDLAMYLLDLRTPE